MKKFINSLALLLLIVFAPVVASAQLNKGDEAPDFTATDDQNEPWTLSDHIGESYIVIYFYPAAMTGGCTKQACGFRDNKAALESVGATVIGISGDEVENLKYFKEAYSLNFPLLSDSDGAIAKKYGVPVNKGGSISQKINGEDVELTRGITTSRWTFIVGKDGKIAYKNTDVNASEDSNEVLKILKAM